MPADEIEIQERDPPYDVVIQAKRMNSVDGANQTRVQPHEDGWQVTTIGGGKPDGPPFDVQAFVDEIRSRVGGEAASFTPKPAENRAEAVFEDGRFE